MANATPAAGSLQINQRGELVTQTGMRVLGDGGPIVFGPGESDAKIAADGTVSSDQGIRGKLRQVRFANPQSAGERRQQPVLLDRQPALPAGPQARLKRAPLERSNVKAVVELTRLMEVQRSYQSLANIMSKSDELRSRAISRLADQQA